FGKQDIEEYSEFKAFFDEIAIYLPITYREDLTLNDFGEVKINVDSETFPVILGTGHEQVFGVMQFMPILAKVMEMTADLKNILHYNRIIINSLADSNTLFNENYDIAFEIPSEQYWLAV